MNLDLRRTSFNVNKIIKIAIVQFKNKGLNLETVEKIIITDFFSKDLVR